MVFASCGLLDQLKKRLAERMLNSELDLEEGWEFGESEMFRWSPSQWLKRLIGDAARGER
jgi:hypothetical protein